MALKTVHGTLSACFLDWVWSPRLRDVTSTHWAPCARTMPHSVGHCGLVGLAARCRCHAGLMSGRPDARVSRPTTTLLLYHYRCVVVLLSSAHCTVLHRLPALMPRARGRTVIATPLMALWHAGHAGHERARLSASPWARVALAASIVSCQGMPYHAAGRSPPLSRFLFSLFLSGATVESMLQPRGFTSPQFCVPTSSPP
jgi:hypothetical protein